MKNMIALLGAFLFLSTNALAAVPGPLVSTEWLAENAGNVVILDVRKDTPSYMEGGHIPGSVLVDYKKIEVATEEDGVALTKMAPSADAFSALMQASGVSNDTTVVITSQGIKPDHVFQATKLYWTFKYYGHDNVAVLNGGTAQWTADNHPISDQFEDEKTGTFTAGAPHSEILATTKQVADASKMGSVSIFDARGLDQYIGLRYKKGFVTKPGHIPGAQLATSSIFLAKKGPKKFESPEKISMALSSLGADGDAIAYCNSGQYSSALWFMMHELAGNDKARLYDGSMHAWTQSGNDTVNQ